VKIVAYCRVSTDREEQLNSLENQKVFFEEYAQKEGHDLVKVYADEGISGTSLKKRTEFRRLMKDANYGLFEMVVVKDISRFARNTVDLLQSVRTLKSLGINTYFVNSNMETLGESEFILTIYGALAQQESYNLSDRIKFGKKINAQKGRVPQRVFGYVRVDNFTLEIIPEEAEVVREIFRLYNEDGLGCRTISLELNNQGYLTKYKCEWNPRAVRRVLLNSIYCGDYVNNKYEVKDCIEGKIVHIPEDQHIHHDRPEWAIVSPEVFQKAQRIMEERRKQYDSGEHTMDGRYSNKHVFSTLIKCEHCGRSFTRKHYKNAKNYWKCVTNDQFTAERCDNTVKIVESELLEKISDYLKSAISNRDSFIQSIISEVEQNKVDIEESIDYAELEKKKKQLEGKKEKYKSMYLCEVISIEELKTKISALDKDIARIDALLSEKTYNDKAIDSAVDDTKRYILEIERFLSLEDVTNMDMRKIIDHISVNRNGEVKVYLKKIAI